MTAEKKKPKKKQYGIRINASLMKELKHLSIDADKQLNILVEESIKDLLIKYSNENPDQQT